MKFTKRKAVLLAGVVAVTVAFVVSKGWFSKPDNSIPGLYRKSTYRENGVRYFRIPGHAFTMRNQGETRHSDIEIKPNGRYASHSYGSQVQGQVLATLPPRMRRLGLDTTMTVNPDGSFTSSKSGTYTLSGRDITFTSRYRRLDKWELLDLKSGVMTLPNNHFVKNGVECVKWSARLTQNGLLIPLPAEADGKSQRISDEELERKVDEYNDSIRGHALVEDMAYVKIR